MLKIADRIETMKEAYENGELWFGVHHAFDNRIIEHDQFFVMCFGKEGSRHSERWLARHEGQ